MYDLMNICYDIEEDKPVLYLFARNKDKRRFVIKVRGFPPRFYAPYTETVNRFITHGEAVLDIRDRLVSEIHTTIPGEVKKVRREFTFTDQADVPYELVYLVHSGIKCGFKITDEGCVPCEDLNIPPRIGRFDIEVSSPVEIMPRPEEPIYPICAFSVKDSYTGRKICFVLKSESKTVFTPDEDEEVVYCDSEYNLLDKAAKFVCTAFEPEKYGYGFDVMQGYFSNRYDWIYIWARSRKIHFDYRKFSPIRVYQVKTRPLFVKEEKDFDIQNWVDTRVDTRRKSLQQRKWSLKIGGFECQDVFDQYSTFIKPEGQKSSWDLKYVIGEETKDKKPPIFFCKHCENRDCDLSGKELSVVPDDCLCKGAYYTDLGDEVIKVMNDEERYLRYCFNDLEALELIDCSRNLTSYYDRARRRVGGFLADIHIRARLVQPLLLRLTDKPLPTARKTLAKKVTGAYVKQPSTGLQENVAVFDTRSTYPTIMYNLNISPERKNPNGTLVAANGTRFEKHPLGLMPRAVKMMMEEREEIKALMENIRPDTVEYDYLWTEQETTKYTTRALWGIMAYENFPLHDTDCNNAITSTGQLIIKRLIEYVNSLGYEVVYGDTDSTHVKLKTADWKEGLELEAKLKIFLLELSKELNFERAPLDIEYEKFYSRVFYKTKKRYCGFCTIRNKKEYNKLLIWGLAAKRSDSAWITVDTQERFFEAVNIEGNKEKALSIVREALAVFNSLPLTKIGIPKGLSRRPETYDHFVWAKAVLWSRENLKLRFREDKKPKLIYGYVEGKPYPHFGKQRTRAFAIEDQEHIPNAVVDYDKMKDKTIRKVFEPLLEAIGLDWASLTSLTRPTRLEAYVTEWVECTSCGTVFPSTDKKCPKCGAPKQEKLETFL